MADRPSSTGRFYVFGRFRFDISRQQLYQDGQPVELTRRLERALQLLLENHGKDLEKSYLMEQLWPNTVVEENNLAVVIFMLRKALGDDVEQKTYILTNPGRGYRFVADVTEVGPTEESHQPPAQEVKRDLEPPELLNSQAPNPIHEKRSTSRRWVALSAALILLSVVSVGVYQWSKRKPTQSIAVLPFQSLGVADNGELGLGMADALIGRLRDMHSVVVRPTADIIKYQNTAYDPIAVGKALNVVSLVDGTVQRLGDQVWLQVKLLRVRDGAVLWAGEYHGRFADMLTIQEQIAKQATGALALRLNSAKQTSIHGHFSGNAEAHQAYLAGRYSCSRPSDRSLKRGVSYFKHATEKDPQFALAYAGLAACYVQLAEAVEPSSRPGFLAEAGAAAQRALVIDRSLQEAYLPLAIAKTYYDWDYPAAEAAFQKSIELAPEIVAGHVEYATFLLSQRRFPQAEREARKAAELDPLSWSADTTISTVYFFERRYAEAAERWEKSREFAPERAPAYLAWIYVSQGRPNSASDEELVSTQAANPANPRRAFYATELAYLYALKGMRSEARSLLQRLQQYPDGSNVDEYETSMVYVALGDTDQALQMLRRAKDNRSNEVILVNVDPRFDSIRADPRFQDLLRSLHLKP